MAGVYLVGPGIGIWAACMENSYRHGWFSIEVFSSVFRNNHCRDHHGSRPGETSLAVLVLEICTVAGMFHQHLYARLCHLPGLYTSVCTVLHYPRYFRFSVSLDIRAVSIFIQISAYMELDHVPDGPGPGIT